MALGAIPSSRNEEGIEMLPPTGAKGAVQAAQAVDSAASISGPGSTSGALNVQKDATESSTAPKFGELLTNLQSKYGAKAEKPREIKKTLGKDDFLRIMITQMRHQDPTSPFKPEQMAQEMAQFTSLEQLQNVNQNLAKMTQANQPMERMAMTNLIGKTVTVDRDRFPHTEGSNETLSFKLPRDAATVSVMLIHESGETVLQKELGPQKAGEGSFNWDGMKSNTLPAKGGNYMLRVEAKDEQGKTVQTSGQGQARVIGVSFEGSEPVFIVGDTKSQSKITMRNIVKIEDLGQPMPAATSAAAGTNPAASTNVNADKPANNFIAFQKGVGSANLDPSQAGGDVAAALAKFQQAQAAGQSSQPTAKNSVPAAVLQNAMAAADNGKGFPNGLGDANEEKNSQNAKKVSDERLNSLNNNSVRTN